MRLTLLLALLVTLAFAGVSAAGAQPRQVHRLPEAPPASPVSQR